MSDPHSPAVLLTQDGHVATLTLNHLSKDAKRRGGGLCLLSNELSKQMCVNVFRLERPTFDMLNDVFATLLAGNLLPYNLDGQRKGLGHTLSHCCAMLYNGT